MDWQMKLIESYCTLCDLSLEGVFDCTARTSSNSNPDFTDEEVLTIYFYGLMEEVKTVKACHSLAKKFLIDFFPRLPGYKQYSKRLKRLWPTMSEIINSKAYIGDFGGCLGFLLDSMPIVLSKKTDKKTSRKLDSIASKGYCASKKMYYYGVKLHIIGSRSLGKIPDLCLVNITPAHEHDISTLKQAAYYLQEFDIYCDKAYCNQSFQNDTALTRGNLIATPIKNKPGTPQSSYEKRHNSFISKIRQPIESLFSMLSRNFGINNAQNVRSEDGLWTHIYGRLSS